MVDAVAGRAALAVLTSTSAADQKSGRKNSALPTPLSASQQGNGQRAQSILLFDRPEISSSVFNTLQNTALLSVARQEVVGEERVRLEEELHRQIIVTETGGSPGSPGTPDKITTVTTQDTTLDAAALDDLQNLLKQFTDASGKDYTDSRLVKSLSDALQRFGGRLGSDTAAGTLGEIIGRISDSVIGKDGLRFSDLFRDPGLFATIGAGLVEFAKTTGSRQAADALRDVILRIGDPRLGDDNHHNDSTRALQASIDRLGRTLAGNQNADQAIQQFLGRLQARDPASYNKRIADVISNVLSDISGGSLDAEAIKKLQSAIEDVSRLADISGTYDDKQRASAVAGLQGILDKNVSTTERTETTVTPGTPAVQATPPTKTITVVEETTLVPRVEIVQRVVTTYQNIQEQIRPLEKLTQPPPPTVAINALVLPDVTANKDDKRNGAVIEAPNQSGKSRFGQDTGSEPTFGVRLPRNKPGQLFDARA